MRVQSGGDAEIMAEVFDGFATAMGAGLLIVLAVLVLLFGDVFQPVTILLSLPLSIGGVILALLLTGEALSMPVVIGVLMLIGIVTKNAIMLVDFAIEARAKGVPRRQAITEAGTKRARPIVMTTVAMVAGMVPSALGIGDGGEFRAPDGDRRDRRADREHAAQPGVRAELLHGDGRPVRPGPPARPPLRRARKAPKQPAE